MNKRNDQPEANSEWQKTPFGNLMRYKPSQVYFARLRVKGKLIRRSLKSDQLSVAKLRRSDLEKSERQRAESVQAVANGKMTFGDALGRIQVLVTGESQHQTSDQRVLRVSHRRPAQIVVGLGGQGCSPYFQC